MAGKSSRAMWADKLAGKPVRSVAFSVQGSSLQRIPYEGTVLGVDPSLRGTGLALVTFSPGGQVVLNQSQTVRMNQGVSMTECLGAIAQAMVDILKIRAVRHVVFEETIFVQNVQTAQIMGAARGAAMGAAAMLGFPVFQYAPLRIKQAVVGYGRASKEQMARMVMQHLAHEATLPQDEADAVGAALCHAFTWQNPLHGQF